ncbi:MAG: efflux RND transporter periplasmic adaptor subunit [Candidatus Cryptobacteroides sp.]
MTRMTDLTKTGALCVCILALCSCRTGGGRHPEVSGEPYRTMVVTATDLSLSRSYAATIRGLQTVEIRPRVSGAVSEIRMDEGQRLKKGQTIMIIDQVPYIAALEVAAANVASAQAALATQEIVTESKRALYRRNVISEFDLGTAENALLEAQAKLAQAKASETDARNNLSYTEVKSPVDGSSGMLPYRVGSLVGPDIATPLVTVSDDSKVRAYFSVTVERLQELLSSYGSKDKALEQMPPVRLRMSGGEMYPLEGRIDAISGTVDGSTGAVSVRATFDNPDGILLDGGVCDVLIPYQMKDAIVIPKEATFEIQDRIFVYKVVDGVTQSSEITVMGISSAKEYAVTSGLSEGEVIVAQGAGLARPGVRVSEADGKGEEK